MSKANSRLLSFLGFAPQKKVTRPRSFKPRFDPLEDRRLLAVVFQVDDNFTDNVAQHKYDTIQEAVDAAVAGDIIRVAAGTYEENVVVNKTLTIRGAGNNNQAPQAIVDPVDNGAGPAFAFDLQANDIVIQHFRIGEFDASGDAEGSVGIRTSSSFSGYKIRDNVIEDNLIGIYLNTATGAAVKKTQVTGNTIRDNNFGFGVLASGGTGIYSDQGARKVEIECNTFTGQQNVDILFAAADPITFAPTFLQRDLHIERNNMTDSSGVLFINVSHSEISHNTIVRSQFNAIELQGGNSEVDIKHNRLIDVGVLGYNGIFLNDANGAGPNHDNTISHNRIENAGLSGIVIRDSSLNTISDNCISGSLGFDLTDPTWGNGISLENADNNVVKGNRLFGNAKDGIFVTSTSTDNLIKKNRARDNAHHDYHDESVGVGTAGTANTYQKNRGVTENVPGLIG